MLRMYHLFTRKLASNGKKICTGRNVAFGSKGDMEFGIKNQATKKPDDKHKSDIQPKARIDQIIKNSETNGRREELDEFKSQLIEKSKKVDDLTSENKGLK